MNMVEKRLGRRLERCKNGNSSTGSVQVRDKGDSDLRAGDGEMGGFEMIWN